MSRHFSIPRRKPRTRRERMHIRLHDAHRELSARWARLHANRRARAAQHRVEELFVNLGHEAHPTHRRRARMPHLRHHH